jgi:chemotaxis protein MotA
MDIATIVGLILGIVLIGGSMFLAGLSSGLSIINFWNLESLMVVLGGTLSATAIAFRLNEVKRVFGLIKFVFIKPAFELDEVVDDIVALGEAYRKDRQSLEAQAANLRNRFLKDGVVFITQGLKIEDLREIMTTREDYRERREASEAGLMKTLGTYSPAFGMVGTLIGLIMMLLGMGSSDGGDMAAQLGQSMSIALITTFYGAVLANLLFLPFAEKISSRNRENTVCGELIIEGLMLIHQKKHPIVIRDMLNSYIPPALRKTEEE